MPSPFPAPEPHNSVLGLRRPAPLGPPWRKAQTPPGGSLRADFDRLASLPFGRLIGGHGTLLEDDASPVLTDTTDPSPERSVVS